MLCECPQPDRDDVCFNKARLLRDYKIAVADYNRAVQLLSLRSGVMTKAEYTDILAFSEQARIKATTACIAMERHAAEHGC